MQEKLPEAAGAKRVRLCNPGFLFPNRGQAGSPAEKQGFFTFFLRKMIDIFRGRWYHIVVAGCTQGGTAPICECARSGTGGIICPITMHYISLRVAGIL